MNFIVITTKPEKIYGSGNIKFSKNSIYFDDNNFKERTVNLNDIFEIIENNEKSVIFPKETAEKIFEKWPEIDNFYYTSDLKAFIRFEEAFKHSFTLKNTAVFQQFSF